MPDARRAARVRRELAGRDAAQPQFARPAQHPLVALTTPVNTRRRIAVHVTRQRDVIAHVSRPALGLADEPRSICVTTTTTVIIITIRLGLTNCQLSLSLNKLAWFNGLG